MLHGYARVSSIGQHERGTIETQTAALERYASEHGQPITIHTDDGISGAEGIDTRPALATLLADVNTGDTVAVCKLDRLARDLMLQEWILAQLWQRGATVVILDPAENAMVLDPHDASRKLVRQIMGAIAEYERAMIRARTVAGKQRARRDGRYTGGRLAWWQQMGPDGQPETSPVGAAAAHVLTVTRAQGGSWRQVAADITERTGRKVNAKMAWRYGQALGVDTARSGASSPSPTQP
jgi:DNA invertase Pin-like site-specific DNA recombinase